MRRLALNPWTTRPPRSVLSLGLMFGALSTTHATSARASIADGPLSHRFSQHLESGAACVHAGTLEDFTRTVSGMVWLEPSRHEGGEVKPPLNFGQSVLSSPWDVTQEAQDRLFWRQFGVTSLPLRWTTAVDWFVSDLERGRHYRFADLRRFSLLRRFTMPSVERYQPERVTFPGLLGPTPSRDFSGLVWRLDSPEPGESLAPSAQSSDGQVVEGYTPASSLDARSAPTYRDASLRAMAPERLPLLRQRVCPPWNRPREVVVTNWGADSDRLNIVDCDGTIAAFALDRVSVLARIPSVANPGTPLPDSPNPPAAWPDEWVDGVHLLHPRLLWVIQQLGEAFPRKVIQIMSGYRRDSRATSVHRQGRAIDVQVRGVENTALFAYCRSLKDVGCGYYPNHPFVHIDVRNAGAKSVLWVDSSMPGEPSQYVDAWPGVIESGALSGAGSE